jgi:hypothetical protein
MSVKVLAHIVVVLLTGLLFAAWPAPAGAQEDGESGAAPAEDDQDEEAAAPEDEPETESSEPGEAAADGRDAPDSAEEPAESAPPAEKTQHTDEAAAHAGAHETSPAAPIIHDRAKRVGSRDAAVKVSLKAIYASREGRGIDHRIRDLARGFQKEFRQDALTKFVLLDSKEFKLGPGLTLPVDIPGGRRLKIENGGVKGKQVVLGLEIEDLIRTTVLLTPNGKFSFGGPKYRYGEGMVIIVVKARPSGR